MPSLLDRQNRTSGSTRSGRQRSTASPGRGTFSSGGRRLVISRAGVTTVPQEPPAARLGHFAFLYDWRCCKLLIHKGFLEQSARFNTKGTITPMMRAKVGFHADQAGRQLRTQGHQLIA